MHSNALILDEFDDNALLLVGGSLTHEYVGLARDWVPLLLANSFMPKMPDNANYRMYHAIDETGKKFTNPLAYDPDVDDSLKRFIHDT